MTSEQTPAQAPRVPLKEDLPFYCLIVGLLFLAYAPVFFSNYAFLDDFPFLRSAQERNWAMFTLLLTVGRPLTAVVLEWAYAAAGSIENLWMIRALTVAGLALAAICTFRALRLAGHRSFPSAAISSVFFLLPSFEVYVAWSQYIIVGPSVCLAYFSFRAALRAARVERGDRIFYLSVAAFLFVLSAALYQPLAMCFWVFAAIDLTGPGSDAGTLKRKLPYLALTGVAGTLGSYLVFRACQTLYPSTNVRFQVTAQLGEKIKWFFSEALRRAVGLNLINSTGLVSALVGAVLLAGVCLYCWKVKRGGLARFLLLVCCVPLSFAPSLVTGENWASSRSLGALTMMSAYLAFLGVLGFAQLLTARKSASALNATVIVMGVWLAGSALLATRNVTTYFVLPQERELAYIKSRLTAPEFGPKTRLVVVEGHWSISAAQAYYYDEFGLASSAARYAVQPMVQMLLAQVRPDKSAVPMRFVPFDTKFTPEADEYIIDMRGLQALR